MKEKEHYLVKQLYLIALFICITACNGQTIKNWNTMSTHGPNSITRNILQDKNDNFWLATWEGIIFYNGKHFINITLKEGLEPFHIFSILEDKSGDLWFGTINGGLFRFDGLSFITYTIKDGLPSNIILCMLEDQTGNIWFGTEDGVSRYDGKVFTNFSKQDGLTGEVNSIVQDKSGKFWFGTRYGVTSDVIQYDGKSFTPFKIDEDLPFSNVRSITEDKYGNIWIGGQNGLFRYDGKSLTNVTTNFIGYIFEDAAGNLWLSEDQDHGTALNKYDGKSSIKIATSSMIFGIIEDNNGNIWFGTGEGIRRYDGKSLTDFKN
jgi:ligand-binding sensor domain-containing protein